jgi:pyruvate,orthophosphate dikinase
MLLGWADEVRRLEVWANADTPEAAQRARALEELEDLQVGDFDRLLSSMDGLPVVVRLLDPPLHEFLPDYWDVDHALRRALEAGSSDIAELVHLRDTISQWEESNPMLGLRGVRLAVVIPEIYRVQVLAALEAVRRRLDAGGDPRLELMIPLVGTVEELHLIRDMIDEEVHYAGRQLEITVGTMIELPRAALVAAEIALDSDFFSFGTNDLTQTTLGISRDDAEEAFLRTYLEQGIMLRNPFTTIDRPGVGRLMQMAISEARKVSPGLPIGVCGEHGGDPDSIAFFHEIGIDYVSVSPPRIPVARLAAAQAALRTAGDAVLS